VRPRIGVVLGSGLGQLIEAVENGVTVGFGELPGFPKAGVAGHAGCFVLGRLGGVDVLFQAGRYHVYEGHPPSVVAAPVRTAAALGVEALILTNAAGGVDPALNPGALVLIRDHLDLMFHSVLAGPARSGEARFPDMSGPYDEGLAGLALEAAHGAGIDLPRGVYAAVTGPSYETAAEIRMLRRLGADVVGMSTVPEVLTARASGLRCLGLSMVTNKGTGLSSAPLSHAEVVDVGRSAGWAMAIVVEGIISRLGGASQSTGAK
jgi:purine-nucleoside phosphorylase